jgi:hypothetical protein
MRKAEQFVRELSSDETKVVAGGVTTRAVKIPAPHQPMDGIGSREPTYSPEELAEFALGAVHQALR